MPKKDLEGITLTETENENIDYSQLGTATKKKSKDEGRREICERATLYFNSDIYREFRYIVSKEKEKPNRVLESLMKNYIKDHK